VIGAFVVLGLVVWAGVVGDTDDEPKALEAASAEDAESEGDTEREATEEVERQAEEEARREAEAEAERKAEEERLEREAREARENPNNYDALEDRDFALLVKDPDNFTGDQVVLFAEVSQFDAATGTDTFRAQASNSVREYWYSDGSNVVVMGEPDLLADVVEDDIVKMHVTSLGSMSYETQIGGNTTVPIFAVHIIEVIG
jgi:hypothetical protein